MSSEQFDFLLIPTRRDALTKVFKLSPEEWRGAIALSRNNGYYPPDTGGLTREAVRWFVPALRRALARIDDATARQPVERLIDFLTGDGACGVVFERRWKRATP